MHRRSSWLRETPLAVGCCGWQVAIRKVMYRDVWLANQAQLELPVEGEPTFSVVMPALYTICRDEFGFEHNEERVCKAMFERTEGKHVRTAEQCALVFLLVMLPILLFTPKAFRSTR